MQSEWIWMEWDQFKAVVTAKTLSIQEHDVGNGQSYRLRAIDGAYKIQTRIHRDGAMATELTDYETNFQPSANKPLNPTDSNNVSITKPKVTQPGWTYDQRSVTFKTSTWNSAESKKDDGSDWGECVLKHYDAQDAEITDQANIAQSVKTVLDWEPPYNYDLMGGEAIVLAVPTGYAFDSKLWCTAVPDLPQVMGGSVNMIDGRVLRDQKTIVADGRGAKTMYYDATYHTNKMRTIIRHGAGKVFHLEMVFELYYLR